MTPIEKARERAIKDRAVEILDKFSMPLDGYRNIYYKQCALIALDYLIDDEMMWQNDEAEPFYFWHSVKQEIEKI